MYWDAMLPIYLLDDHPLFADRVRYLLAQAYEQDDRLFISCVGLGEIMAGAAKSPNPTTGEQIRRTLDEMGFSYLPFLSNAVSTFSSLRSIHRIKTADAIHLASAGAEGIDLFLTGDKDLTKLSVAGIHRIADFNNPIF